MSTVIKKTVSEKIVSAIETELQNKATRRKELRALWKAGKIKPAL